MIRLVSVSVMLFGIVAVAVAQVPLAQPAPLTQPAPAASVSPGKAERKEARDACQGDASTKGLVGKARREAVRDCMKAKFPDSAISRPTGLTRDGKPTAKAARAACKDETAAKGLRGSERKTAIAACFKEKRPDLAARAECRKEAKAKGLGGEELKTAIKSCARS